MSTNTVNDVAPSLNGSYQWPNATASLAGALGLRTSFYGSLFSSSYLFDSAKLLLVGSVIETGRRVCQWLMERFKLQYSITARFDQGDPAYEWIINLLTQEKVWRRSRDFRVTSKTTSRKWGVQTEPGLAISGHADYVPTYDYPQIFRFNGYWIEIKRSGPSHTPSWNPFGETVPMSTISLTVYTLDVSVLSNIVEEAHRRYIESSRPNIIVHTVDSPNFGPNFVWTNVKRKIRRPLSSIILQPGVIDSLVKDLREFIDSEEWYTETGIPHRRGYLLFGPPGSGKTSTIYALAGELGLEIYSLSLASGFVDDSCLQRAASSIPKLSIFLIEDIDCAFASRDDDDEQSNPFSALSPSASYAMGIRKPTVTLSGLLNVLDGVGSDEGRLFFATTNCVDRLDPALIRPGRIDVKIQYNLATKEQTRALFLRFFPESPSGLQASYLSEKGVESDINGSDLADSFTEKVPESEFSTAELQGYLLQHKMRPRRAVDGIQAWVDEERQARKEKEERERARRNKSKKVAVKEMDGPAIVDVEPASEPR